MTELHGWVDTGTQAVLAAIGVVNLLLLLLAGRNIKKIELATNSMKDALVQSTKETGELTGEKRERDRQDSAAGVAEGREQMRAEREKER
jgi:hypothetical protein